MSSAEAHGSPFQRRHTLVAAGMDEQPEDNSSPRAATVGVVVREGNTTKYTTNDPRSHNDGDEDRNERHDAEEGLPAFRRKASHSAPSIRTKEGTNPSSLFSTRDDGTVYEPSQFIGIAGGSGFEGGMDLELAGRGGGGGFATTGYDSVLANGEPLGGRGGAFSSYKSDGGPSVRIEDQHFNAHRPVVHMLSGGGGRGAESHQPSDTAERVLGSSASSASVPKMSIPMTMAGVPPLSRPAHSPNSAAANARKGADFSSSNTREARGAHAHGGGLEHSFSSLSHSRDLHTSGKGKANNLGGGTATSSVESGRASSPKRAGNNEKSKSSSSPLRSSSQFVSSSFASNAMGTAGTHLSSPTMGGHLRKRTRDAWDRRIREQMWLFDSHNPSHPRNDPSAPQEDTVDSFEYGPDVLGTGAGMLGGSSSSPHGVGVGRTTISADGVPISAIPAEGRSRVAGSTIIDTSSQGGAVMVVGETGRSADAGTQSMFGSTADACVATVITTADLASLIPFHDDALMLRATLPSLQRLERHALKLLGHVRREIESQTQNAGVSYRRHHFDGNTNMNGFGGLNQEDAEEHHKSRKGQLGSRSIADLRRGLAEKALLMSAVSGVGGATSGGASQLMTSVTVDGRGRTSINAGAPFSNRSELMYSGGINVGGALGRPRDVFDPLLMSNAPSLGGVTNVGLVGSSSLVHGNAAGGSGSTSKLPFTGVSGYSLYDEQAKSSAVSLLTLGEEMTRRHHTFDNINHSVEYYSPLAVLGDARGHGQGQSGVVSPSLPHPEHPTGGYTYTTLDGVTLGQWSRELDVATKGMGLQGFSEAQAKQLKEELERREVLRRALESINTKKQLPASTSFRNEQQQQHDVSFSSFGNRGGAGLRSEETRGGQRVSYAADPHRSALSNTYNQNNNLDGIGGGGSGWSFSDASSSARREGYLPSATAAAATATANTAGTVTSSGITRGSSSNNLMMNSNWYNGSSLVVSPTTTDASNQKSFSLAAPSTPAGMTVSFADRATKYVGR